MSVDLMDASSDGALSPPRADPLSKHSLLILVGPGGCQTNKIEFIDKNESAKEEFQNFCVCLWVSSILFPRAGLYKKKGAFASCCLRCLIIQLPLIFPPPPPLLLFSQKHPTPQRPMHAYVCLLFILSCVGTKTKGSILKYSSSASTNPTSHSLPLCISPET